MKATFLWCVAGWVGVALAVAAPLLAGSPLSNDPSPLVVCQDTIRVAAVRLAAETRRGIGACLTRGVECVADPAKDHASCCARAAARCASDLAKVAKARQRFSTQIESRRCADVPFVDVLAGLGYEGIAARCPALTPAESVDTLAALIGCLERLVVRETACPIGTIELPRAAEGLECLGIGEAFTAVGEADLATCGALVAPPSPTASPESRPTATPGPTTTIVAATATVSPVRTATPIATASPVATLAPTATRSPTPLATGTPATTSTSTIANTATATRTSTPVPTVTASAVTATVTPVGTSTSNPTTTATRTTPVPTVTAVPSLTSVATITPVPTGTSVPTATATRTATPAPTATSIPTTTAVPTTTSVSTATATRTATPVATTTATRTATPAPTATSTPSGGPVCGNSVKEAGEDCDDGNTFDCDECPSNCKTAPPDCSATATRAPQTVKLIAPAGQAITSGLFCLKYPSGTVGFPGTGLVAQRTSGFQGTTAVNDFNNAVRVGLLGRTAAAEVSVTLSFDLCAGATAPLPTAFSCRTVSASNAGVTLEPDTVQCSPVAP